LIPNDKQTVAGTTADGNAHRDVVSLLIYEFNFALYSACRAKPE
jgi:hypothetical protein